MDKDFTSPMEESINLELNVADLYLLFNKLFSEDTNFWWSLALEEKSHAALIRSGKEFFEPKNQFPPDLLADSLQTLKDINSKLNLLIKKYEAPCSSTIFTCCSKPVLGGQGTGPRRHIRGNPVGPDPTGNQPWVQGTM